MGTCISKDRTEHQKYGFNEEEFDQVKKIYQSISEFKSKTYYMSTIGKKGLQMQFPENPELAIKIYNWMQQCNKPDPVTFESYIHCIQLLTHNTTEFKIVSYNNRIYEPIETTAFISIEKYLKEKEELPKILITYSQGLRLIKEILNIFRDSRPTAQTNDLPAKVLASGIFSGNNSTAMDFNMFIFEIKHQLELINHYLRVYYYSKFIDHGIKRILKIPTLETISQILNEDLLSLFCLTTEHFQRADELTLLFSTNDYGGSFKDLVIALKGYEAPTLVLVKHGQKDVVLEPGSKVPINVFGGFASVPWKDQPEYHGDSGCFLFSLIPKFRKFYPTSNGHNYQYLNGERVNDSKFTVGLGFGGSNDESFRLWIDEKMELGTFSSPEDLTYEKGHLIDPSISTLNIDEIEIWGLGGLSAKTKQEIHQNLYNTKPNKPKKKINTLIKKLTGTNQELLTSGRSNGQGEQPQQIQGHVQPELNGTEQDVDNLPILGYDENNINAD